MDKQRRKQIVIAGGGITGLSTAYYVEQLCRAHAIEAEIVLVEKSDRFGGHVHTGKKDGFVIERGPDSFLARKTSIIELMQELGIGDDIVGTRPGISHSYIAYRNQLHPIPDGFMLGVPTKWKPFLTTKLISVRGKVRAAADLVLPRKSNVEDESLGQLLRRRLGDEVLEQIAEPLLAGIYAGNADALSVQATFPMLQETEQKHRSLIVGMLGVRKSRAPKQTTQSSQTTSKTTNKSTSKTGSGNGSGSTSTVKKSMFLSARGGLEEVVTHLEKSLSSSINMMKNTEISGVTHEGERYVVHLHNGTKLHADAMVIATPAHVAARLLPDESISKLLQTIPYASVMNVVLAYREQDVGISLEASGFVVPRKEGRTVTACTWTSSKWAHTAPEGHILLRAYVGKYGQENDDQLSDEKLVHHVRRELEEMMGISAEPIFTEVNRLPDAMPQYKVGHLERMQDLDDALATVMPGVYLGGGGYRGIGVPDCISQGKAMANKLLTRLIDMA
ncbi:protoporphyrinogen oxidase [Paenibacillus tundrae]|uniref:Coproporphyrinogen III oxidase n=1 Tax=Paenibacillus tundrae TaxID=528187 RepID=A0ABT9WHT4_9BACL|nr:protoporphyrinogen oxidase [Paenibacillus tundrae]MDQ0172836.1 oxygen-dependent protoporphyrinogen oxidase [Paenibacillus tundrae]